MPLGSLTDDQAIVKGSTTVAPFDGAESVGAAGTATAERLPKRSSTKLRIVRIGREFFMTDAAGKCPAATTTTREGIGSACARSCAYLDRSLPHKVRNTISLRERIARDDRA